MSNTVSKKEKRYGHGKVPLPQIFGYFPCGFEYQGVGVIPHCFHHWVLHSVLRFFPHLCPLINSLARLAAKVDNPNWKKLAATVVTALHAYPPQDFEEKTVVVNVFPIVRCIADEDDSSGSDDSEGDGLYEVQTNCPEKACGVLVAHIVAGLLEGIPTKNIRKEHAGVREVIDSIMEKLRSLHQHSSGDGIHHATLREDRSLANAHSRNNVNFNCGWISAPCNLRKKEVILAAFSSRYFVASPLKRAPIRTTGVFTSAVIEIPSGAPVAAAECVCRAAI